MTQLPQYVKRGIAEERTLVTSLSNPRRRCTDNLRSFKVSYRDLCGFTIATVNEVNMMTDEAINTWSIDPDCM